MRTCNPYFRKRKLSLRSLGTARAWWQALVWNSLGWGRCTAGPASPGWQLLQPRRDLDAGLPASLGHGQQAEVVAAAPDPTAPGSSSFPTPASYRDLGQDPSLALSPVGWVCTGCFWIFLSVNFESFSINYTPGISSILGPCHPILDSKALTLPWDSCCGTLLNSTATFPET